MNPPFPARVDLSRQHLLLVINLGSKDLVAARCIDADVVIKKFQSANMAGARYGFVLEIGEHTLATTLHAIRTRLVDYAALHAPEELPQAIAKMQLRQDQKGALEKAANDAIAKVLAAFEQ